MELTPSQRQVFKQHFLLSHWGKTEDYRGVDLIIWKILMTADHRSYLASSYHHHQDHHHHPHHLVFIWFTEVIRSASSLVAPVAAVSLAVAHTGSPWWSRWSWLRSWCLWWQCRRWLWWRWWQSPVNTLMIIRLTCQYTVHCYRLPQSLHKRMVDGLWRQHLGKHTGENIPDSNIPPRKILPNIPPIALHGLLPHCLKHLSDQYVHQ